MKTPYHIIVAVIIFLHWGAYSIVDSHASDWYDHEKMRGAIEFNSKEWAILCAEFEKMTSLSWGKAENRAALIECIENILERDCDTFFLFYNAMNTNMLRELSLSTKIDRTENLLKMEAIALILVYLQEYLYGEKQPSVFFRGKNGEFCYSSFAFEYYSIYPNNPLFDFWLEDVFLNSFARSYRGNFGEVLKRKDTIPPIASISAKNGSLISSRKQAAIARWRAWSIDGNAWSKKTIESRLFAGYLRGFPVEKFLRKERTILYVKKVPKNFQGKIYMENKNWKQICKDFEELLELEFQNRKYEINLLDGMKHWMTKVVRMKHLVENSDRSGGRKLPSGGYEKDKNFARRNWIGNTFTLRIFLLALDANLRGQLSISEKIDKAEPEVKAQLLRELIYFIANTNDV